MDCRSQKHQCNDGTCIFEHELCDGKRHCSDGSDETLDLCIDTYCPPFAFKCNYGGCISGDTKCNGFEDCIDGSDETLSLCKPTTVTIVYQAQPVQDDSCSTKELINRELTLQLNLKNILVGFRDKIASGIRVAVSCDSGSILVGSKDLLCLNGNWDQKLPTCQSERINPE